MEPDTRYQPTDFSQPMALKRKPHRKSRTGCSECKRRRIKVRSHDGALAQPNPAQCDEEKPRCTYSVRHERPCVYPGTSAALRTTRSCNLSTPAHSLPLSQTSQAALRTEFSQITQCFAYCARSAILSGVYFELKGLALLHHWTRVTSRSIVNTPQLDHFWQTVLPEIAF